MYDVRRSNTALASSTDFWTFLSGASHGVVILEMDFNGQGVASAQGELGVYVCTSTGTTPGGAITAQPINTRYSAVAATTTVYTTWSAAPTIGSEPIFTIPINGNGERFRWIWNGDWGNAITIAPGTAAANYLTFRQIAGTPTVTGRVRFAEV